MLAINSELSRPNVLGQPSFVWPVSALKDYIRFNQAQFPNGFSPFATVEVMHEFMPPAPPPAIEAVPFPHLLEPSPPAIDQELEAAYLSSVPPSVGASWPNLDYDFGTIPGSEDYQENSIASGYHPMATNMALVGNTHLPPPTLVFHEHIVWKGQDIQLTSDYKSDITDSLRYSHWNRPLFLTKCLYLTSLWIGLANPWDLPERVYRVLITNCFLSALDLSKTTSYLTALPVIVTDNSGEFRSSIGWNTLRLTFSNHIANRTSEMWKLIRACIVFRTGFSGVTGNEKNDRVEYFYRLLNSDQCEQVQQGIVEIVELQMFTELVWFVLFQPTGGLVKGNNRRRMADLLPEEVRCNEVLGIGVVVTLMTLVYQTLHQWRTPNAKGRQHTITYDVIMYALRGMYNNLDQFPRFRNVVRKLPFISAANVFPMDPKNDCPRGRAEAQPRVLKDIEPIAEVNHHLLSLPNATFLFTKIFVIVLASKFQNMRHDCSILDGSTSSIAEPATMHEAKRTFVISNCVSSSLPMLSTWVAVGIQEAFYDAFHAERACQAGLMTESLTVGGEHAYQRNLGLELLILQAKMRRAQAEIDLYTVTIENAREFDFSTISSKPLYSSGFIPPPRPDELCYYEENRNDVTDDFDNFEFE
ncbi:hypothetical protein DFH29DRAFT_1001044 [Suillus ampliporus]|nr:hypothetical protein DFH29DRAFT_1001044 [Suillus ampliporus]